MDRVDTQERLFSFMTEKVNERKVINFKDEPCIAFYYFVDNGITKEKFE